MSNSVIDFIKNNTVKGSKVINVEFNEFFDSYAIVKLKKALVLKN